MKKHKYIFVVGGVISGVGKGITASSLGKILQARGLEVTAVKIDPYVNVDAGTMNPTEHGEVFVLNDGNETDQDMGNYERFLDITLSRTNYMTTGLVYKSVIEKERNLAYKGQCVQVVPHIPLEIIQRIEKAAEKAQADVTIVEIGGTVGEYENILFLEAARMMKIKQPDGVFFVVVSYMPTPAKVGEMKTKPTQHAIRALNSAGIQADILIARSDVEMDKKRRDKLATFCNIPHDRVVSAPDVESIYDIPGNFERHKLGDLVIDVLGLKTKKNKSDLKEWKKFVQKTNTVKDEVNIAIIGKYFDTGDFVLSDAYISIIEALKYSAYHLNKKPKLHWLNAEDFSAQGGSALGGEQKKNLSKLKKYDGVLVPGGFGERGIEGKLNVIQYVRENKISYFGICYGMQLMVIEYARNVLGIESATTAEINPNIKELIIDIMPEQKKKLSKKDYGGSMRLGAYEAVLQKGTIAEKAYKQKHISERHRHRFEVNPQYIKEMIDGGLIFSGVSPNGQLMEIAELPLQKHPFFLGTQFHPEFQARPLKPHPLFTSFLESAIKRSKINK